MPHDSANVLGGRLLSINVIEGICLIGQKAKGNACWYFKVMGENVDPAARVVIEGIAVKVAELKGISL